jgi:hypothetical protein
MTDLLSNIFTAGVSAVLTLFVVHPIDTVKTRLQIENKAKSATNPNPNSIIQTIQTIKSENGLKGFYRGIGPAIMRESTYTSLRLGLYGPIKQLFDIKSDSNFFLKFMAGSASGLIGSIAGNPFDVLKTKMIANATNSSHNSTQIVSGKSLIIDIYQTNGLKGFYKGLSANLMRACVLNGTKMACYDQIKESIIKSNMVKNDLVVQFVSAFLSGFFMSITVTPFDMIRTKLMSQPMNQKIYNGFFDCAKKVIKQNGPMGLYTGFIPIWMRFAPTTTLQLVIFDQLKTRLV